MLSSIVFVCVLFSIPLATPCEVYPNDTDKYVSVYPCDNVKSQISFLGAELQDSTTHKKEYPINLTYPLDMVIQLASPAEYSALTLFINLYSWTNCAWQKLSTFGLLSKLDACKSGLSCPIQKGQHTTIATLDFSKVDKIIKLLTNNAPYRIDYRLTDKNKNVAFCLTVEMLVVK